MNHLQDFEITFYISFKPKFYQTTNITGKITIVYINKTFEFYEEEILESPEELVQNRNFFKQYIVHIVQSNISMPKQVLKIILNFENS